MTRAAFAMTALALATGGACAQAVRFEGLRISKGLYDAQGNPDPKGRVKPAQLSYTRPSDSEASASIDAGAEATFGFQNLSPGLQLIGETSLGVEQHRNTATKNKQDTILAGVGIRGGVGRPGDVSLIYAANALYRDDRAADSHGFLTGVTLFPYIPTKLNALAKLDDNLRVFPTLAGGLEYERVSSSGADNGTGGVTRLTAVAGLEFWFGADKRLSVGYEYKHWYDASRSGAFAVEDRNQHIHRANVAYQLNDFTSIALEYVDGTDPVEGLAKQRYTQIVLQFGGTFFGSK